jgi:uncharacterized lipoprotein YddW (UPF0748 family)
MNFFSTTIIIICAWASALCQAAPLELFSGPNANLNWKSPQASNSKPILINHTPALRLTCPLIEKNERCYWEAPVKLNLASIAGISFNIKIANPKSVSRGTIYLHSGQGWYGGWFKTSGRSTVNVHIPRSEFGAEDAPAGWHNIDRVRIAIWRNTPGTTTITISDPKSWNADIIIIRNNSAFKNFPAETSTITRACQRTHKLFQNYGTQTAIFNDNDIAGNLPPNTRLAILPYNPYPPPTTIQAIKKFAAHGGKIINFYALPPELAPILGLSGKTWRKTGPNAIFSTITFRSPGSTGLPDSILQDSWNANIPIISNAATIAYWQDANHKNTKLPAITKSANGIFVSHLLTPPDHEKKSQFLLAASIMLCPSLKKELLSHMLTHSEKLLSANNWLQSRKIIIQTASHNHKISQQKLLKQIEDIERYRTHTRQILTTASSAKIIYRINNLKKMIRTAYFCNIPPKTNEFRGIWCHKAQGIPGMSWNQIAATIRKSGFNALFPNMLWPGCAYYPSKIVPPPPPTDPAQGDMLKTCIKACRKHHLQIHLWKVCWNLTKAQPNFIAKMRQQNRLQQTANGQTKNWLCPSDPRNRKLEKNAIIEAVNNYDIDGIHLDYIRYPDSTCCFCTGCRQRFQQDTGAKITHWPADVTTGYLKNKWQNWRRKQITSFVADISHAIKATNKNVKLSVAVYGSWPSCRNTIAQDWISWGKNGYVDFICPMNYSTDDNEVAQLTTRQLTNLQNKLPLYPGLGPSARDFPPEQTIHQLQLIRQLGTPGFLLFNLDHNLINLHLPALHAGATSK